MNVTITRKHIAEEMKTWLTTGFAAIALAIFLMPFLYMVLTSLKTDAQITQINAPIWPVAPPTFTYTGGNTNTYTVQVNKVGTLVDQTIDMKSFVDQALDVYTVKLENGTTKNLALLKGFQKGSIFLDPKNIAAGPIVWNGGNFNSLQRPWILSPTWKNYVLMWNSINFPRILLNTIMYAFTTTIGVLFSCILMAYGFSRFRFPLRDFLFMILISILFLPGTVTIIPTFYFFTQDPQLERNLAAADRSRVLRQPVRYLPAPAVLHDPAAGTRRIGHDRRRQPRCAFCGR